MINVGADIHGVPIYRSGFDESVPDKVREQTLTKGVGEIYHKQEISTVILPEKLCQRR